MYKLELLICLDFVHYMQSVTAQATLWFKGMMMFHKGGRDELDLAALISGAALGWWASCFI